METTTTPTTLVTGASSGIGEEVCRRLAAKGHLVVNLSHQMAPADLPAKSYLVDLTDQKQTDEILAEVVEHHRIDHLVNNAGVAHDARLEDIAMDDLRRIFELHVRATLQCIQAIAPAMKERGDGRIVNMGSRTMLGKPQATGYAATKAAIVGMSRCLALELAPFGVTVNVVAPGPTKTDFFGSILDLEDPKMIALKNDIPIGRFAQVGDVAGAVEYFLSDTAGFVTGQTLYVCGGLSVGTVPV